MCIDFETFRFGPYVSQPTPHLVDTIYRCIRQLKGCFCHLFTIDIDVHMISYDVYVDGDTLFINEEVVNLLFCPRITFDGP